MIWKMHDIDFKRPTCFARTFFPNLGSTARIWYRAPFPQDKEPMPYKNVQSKGPTWQAEGCSSNGSHTFDGGNERPPKHE
jgi:hypothetical protein